MILARNRFEGAVMIAQTVDPRETDWLLSLAARHEWIRAVLTRIEDPHQWDRWLGNAKFAGLETVGVASAAEAERRGLAMVLPPAEGVTALDTAPALRLAIQALAGVRFAASEFDEWARALEPFSKTQTLMRIDGLLNFIGPGGWRAETYRPWVAHLLETFGAARICWGSGWPLSMPHATWKESLACFTQAMGARTIEDREQILGENAVRFFAGPGAFSYTR